MRRNPFTGPLATLGTTLAAHLDLWGDCTKCRRHIHVDTPALEQLAARYGRDAVLLEVSDRIVCRECGGKADLRVHVPAPEPWGWPTPIIGGRN